MYSVISVCKCAFAGDVEVDVVPTVSETSSGVAEATSMLFLSDPRFLVLCDSTAVLVPLIG